MKSRCSSPSRNVCVWYSFAVTSGRRLVASLLLILLTSAMPAKSIQAADTKEGSQPPVASSRPNFIVINIDDLGYGDIEPFGSTKNRTPNLTRMASEGRKLTSFYAAPVCSPSRASLMTGCYPKRALTIPHVLFPGNSMGLHPDEVTLAELLKAQGYATGIVGKWHLGDQPEFLPTRQGFDSYYGLPYSNDMGPAADGIKSNLGQPLPMPKNPKGGQPPLPLMRNETVLQRVLPDDQQAIVERYTHEAVNFVWEHRDEPFFLYLPHSAVHWPLYPGKRFAGTSNNGLFGDWVEEVDWSVGEILTTLRELKLDRKTLVIFTSDNGGQQSHGAVNLPLRGGKGSTLEGGIRVPTIAWWPGSIPAGTETAAITSMMDVLPTFVQLAGGKAPADRKIDGADIWPLLQGAAGAIEPHQEFYYFRGLKLQAVRSGPWKLHLEKGELYNLESDIGEANNVSAANPEVVAGIRKLVEKMDQDLGVDGKGVGCRPLGTVTDAQPLISQDGTTRPGFEAPTSFAGQGILVGEVDAESAYVQVRLTASDKLVDGDLPGAEGVVQYQLFDKTGTNPIGEPQLIMAKADVDYITRLTLDRLLPGTGYVVKTQIGLNADSLRPGPIASFETLPGETMRGTARFVVVTGMNYAKFHGDAKIDREQHLIQNNTELPPPYAKPDKHLGYPALDTIRRLNPDFFVGTGDNVYYDTPTKPRAETIEQMRKKWHEQFVQPRYHQLFAKVPAYWMVDDHDFRVDDCDNSGEYAPSVVDGRRMMFEQLPYGPQGTDEPKSYRTVRVNKDLQLWFPENRLYRSPNSMADGPEKSIWGAEQKAWLKRTLAESDATYKLLISPTPMVGPDDKRKTDNHTNFGGFRHERDEFFSWLNETGLAKQNFYILCGDRHWQYHALDPAGIEEFSCGALVDANSRLGRSPGDPASTDPDGLIRQFYSQKTASGGFLMVELSYGSRADVDGVTTPRKPELADGAPQLTFSFHDEHGTLLYRQTKEPAAK
ncbi:MAG: sulfatase-like hydrolase/transferase [Planctomycetaceae bacterium]